MANLAKQVLLQDVDDVLDEIERNEKESTMTVAKHKRERRLE